MLYKFKEAVDIISGGTPKTSVPEYWNGDIGWLSVVDFGDKNKYVETTEKTITQAGVDNSSTKVLQINDIIISARGTVGAMAMLKKPLAFNQSCFGLRGKTEIINQEYLFYYLKNYMKVLKAKTQGSVFDTINLATFDLIDLNLPTLDKQERIAHILATIDNKIDANQAINAELESMAKTIYDYWFLQFEFPNEEGKPYKSSGGKMVWCEELKREIPEGWELTTLGEMFHITMGSSPKGDSLNEVKCGIEFYQGSTDFGNIYPNERVYTTSPIRKATSQDVLLSVRAPVGDMNIAMNDCCIGRGLAAIHSESTLLTWNTLKSLHSYFDVYNNNGTTFGALTADLLKGLITLNIPPRLIQEYEKQVSGFEKIIRNKELESRSLSSLRDFLLPTLMNGQVTFKDN